VAVGTDRTLSSVDSPALTKKEQIAKCRETGGDVIAIVNDDPGERKSLARLVSVFGYCAELFASAEEFQSAAPTSKATCLIVDFNLGDMSGLELARWLCAAGNLPIIFNTGSADVAMLPRSKRTTFNLEFCTKPYNN
jgi:FixJ family two-component response regulator